MPTFFRDRGFDTTTVLEQFGRTDVPDEEWIRWAGEENVVVAHKDSRIRYRPSQIDAVRRYSARMLCLTKGNLMTAEQVECFEKNLATIEKHWARPGPWILAIRPSGVRDLDLS